MVDFSAVSDFFNEFKEKFSGSGKKKESSEVEEPALPDTAKDIYGDVSDTEPEGQEEDSEVEESGDEEDKPPEELPEMEFPEPEEKNEEEQQPQEAAKEEHKIVPESSESMPAMEEEIKEFESAIGEIQSDYPESYLERDTQAEAEYSEPRQGEQPDHGFFSEFQHFLEGNEIADVADELVEHDLLGKMKDFHMHKEEGEPYYFHSNELEEAIKKKMMHLRDLEREWFVHKKRMEREEKLLMQKEEDIDEELEELKYLMNQLKKRDEFKREVDEGDYFYLSNGQVLKSLSGLRAALRVMDHPVFYDHVRAGRNDFADWIENVFDDRALADELRACNSKEEMLDILVEAEKD